MNREKRWTMFRCGATLFPALLLVFFFAVGGEAAEYCAYYKLGPSLTLEPGAATTVPVTVQNCGTLTWPANGQFRLSYHIKQGSTQVLYEGQRTLLPVTVGPNGTVSLQAQFKAVDAANQPLAEGQYEIRWNMVHEGVAWFAAKGVPAGKQALNVKKKLSVGSGSVQGNLVAAPGPSLINALCQAVNCDGSVQPVITGVFIGGPVKPGSAVILFGKGFGVAEGMVDFSGDFGKRQPKIIEWYDNGVGVKIPDDIEGVQDHVASFVVRRASDKKESAPHSVQFHALREVKEVPGSAVGGGCSCNSDCDKCSHKTCGDCDAFIAGAAVSGNHETHFPDTHGDSGTDTFTLALKNGWTFYDRQCWGLKNVGSGFPVTVGSKYMDAKVNWSTDVGEYVNYHCIVSIEGPKGVSYK